MKDLIDKKIKLSKSVKAYRVHIQFESYEMYFLSYRSVITLFVLYSLNEKPRAKQTMILI